MTKKTEEARNLSALKLEYNRLLKLLLKNVQSAKSELKGKNTGAVNLSAFEKLKANEEAISIATTDFQIIIDGLLKLFKELGLRTYEN